jgi:tetratricopeptide (TPR) repeat protein
MNLDVKMTLTQFVRFAAVGSLVLLAAGANAQSIDDARAAFEEGRFLEAANLAEALGTSGGYALAAQSLAVYGHRVATGGERTGFLERAMQLGEEAVCADSTNPEAYYQSAHAVGRYAQSVGILTALRRGLAGRARGLLEAALAISPDFAEVHMAFGGWHAAIASAGRVARFIYGGNRENAVIHYERALELAPDSKVVLLEYALRLPELDREGGRERARKLLSKAAELPVRDAYEKFIQQEVLEVLAELEGGG